MLLLLLYILQLSLMYLGLFEHILERVNHIQLISRMQEDRPKERSQGGWKNEPKISGPHSLGFNDGFKSHDSSEDLQGQK
mgnify:CR=1 FL=1